MVIILFDRAIKQPDFSYSSIYVSQYITVKLYTAYYSILYTIKVHISILPYRLFI